MGRSQERLREPGLCHFEKKGMRGIKLQSSASQGRFGKKVEARLFSGVHSRRMGGNGCKLLQGQLQLDLQEKLFLEFLV